MNLKRYFAVLLGGALALVTQLSQAEVADTNVTAYADKILGRTVNNTNVVDRNADAVTDIRDLVIYINGLPLQASFATPETTAFAHRGSASIEVRFTRSISGVLSYNLGGTARSGSDYTGLTGTVSVTNAYSAFLPIGLPTPTSLRPPRDIVLTLKSPGTNPPPGQSFPTPGAQSAHRVRILDADYGLYFGSLSFPSSIRIDAQGTTNINPIVPCPASGFRMGVRSVSGTAGTAVIELPEFPISGPLAVPVTLSSVPTNQPAGFTAAAPLIGSTNILLAAASRQVAYILTLSEIAFTDNQTVFSARASLQITGLSVTGAPLSLDCALSGVRIDQ
jgi:hypothetical protein